MKMNKKDTEANGIPYARKEDYEYDMVKYEADIQHGDILEIKDSGSVEQHPSWGDQHYFVLETRNGEKRVKFNQSSINACVDKWGDNSEDWQNKKVKIWTRKDVIGGRKVIVAYALPSGFLLDEFGDVVDDRKGPEPRTDVPVVEKSEAQKEVEEIRQLDPEDIPF